MNGVIASKNASIEDLGRGVVEHEQPREHLVQQVPQHNLWFASQQSDVPVAALGAPECVSHFSSGLADPLTLWWGR